MRTKSDLATRFWKKVSKTERCWNWIGGKLTTGYGQFRLFNGERRAHRVSWVIKHGIIPDGMCVLHKCDNRLCVNPDHLFLGTILDNNRDCISKGRSRSFVGANNPKAKLTPEQAQIIRERRKAGVFARILAKEFGLCRSHVSEIGNSIHWK